MGSWKLGHLCGIRREAAFSIFKKLELRAVVRAVALILLSRQHSAHIRLFFIQSTPSVDLKV